MELPRTWPQLFFKFLRAGVQPSWPAACLSQLPKVRDYMCALPWLAPPLTIFPNKTLFFWNKTVCTLKHRISIFPVNPICPQFLAPFLIGQEVFWGTAISPAADVVNGGLSPLWMMQHCISSPQMTAIQRQKGNLADYNSSAKAKIKRLRASNCHLPKLRDPL